MGILSPHSGFFAAVSGKKELFRPILDLLNDITQGRNGDVENLGCMAKGNAEAIRKMANYEQIKAVEKKLSESGGMPIVIGGRYLSTPAKKYPKGTKFIVFDRHFDAWAYGYQRFPLNHANFIRKMVLDGLIDPNDVIVMGSHHMARPGLDRF